jgi:hypothetical protein
LRARVVISLLLLVVAKGCNVLVPLAYARAVDMLAPTAGAGALLVIPVALVIAYGIMRALSSVFAELRDDVFTKVQARATRQIALQVFQHLHALSLRYHLDRQTGGLTRLIERGVRGIIHRPWRFMGIVAALFVLMGVLFVRLPSSFLPNEDQGVLMALGCNHESYEQGGRRIDATADYAALGAKPGSCHHCHTGRCPVGITTQDAVLEQRLQPESGARHLKNDLKTLTMELTTIARACGKQNVHHLEPEDLVALTVEAAAMARLPLAGTNWIPGVGTC